MPWLNPDLILQPGFLALCVGLAHPDRAFAESEEGATGKTLIWTAMAMFVAMPLVVQAEDHGVMHLQSSDDIALVEQRLREAIEDKGLTLMTVVDHTANAEGVAGAAAGR